MYRVTTHAKLPPIMVQFIVNITAPLGFLGGAIWVGIVYAPRPFSIWFASTLFCGFIAVGPIRWLDHRIQELIESQDQFHPLQWENAMKLKCHWFLFFEILVVVLGIAFFLKGLSLLN
ncbi:hypothetical protein ACFLVG_06250 [Chloroflexota bacterium]